MWQQLALKQILLLWSLLCFLIDQLAKYGSFKLLWVSLLILSFCSSKSDSSDHISGAASDHGAGDGTENEHSGQQQSQHATRSAANEQAVPPQHTSVGFCITEFTATSVEPPSLMGDPRLDESEILRYPVFVPP